MKGYCGGCGKKIWPWQKTEFHNLGTNSWRPYKVKNQEFHSKCWKNFPEEAK